MKYYALKVAALSCCVLSLGLWRPKWDWRYLVEEERINRRLNAILQATGHFVPRKKFYVDTESVDTAVRGTAMQEVFYRNYGRPK